MSSFSALKTAIQAAIKQNGNNEITGDILQDILLSIVSTLGDSAINNLETGLSSEASTRGNADTTLQTNINNEATARQNADSQLNNLITGIKNNIDNGYVYAGIATPSTSPVSGKVFYIATQAGTYTNLGNTAVKPGMSILKYNGSAWSNEQVIYTDGGVFDVSAYNGGATYASLEALLSDANLLTIIPPAVRKGGMSIKFVSSVDNKYVQYRLMSDTFNTNVVNWQGLDDVPTAGSHNLMESGGVKILSSEIFATPTATVSPILPEHAWDYDVEVEAGKTYLIRHLGGDLGNINDGETFINLSRNQWVEFTPTNSGPIHSYVDTVASAPKIQICLKDNLFTYLSNLSYKERPIFDLTKSAYSALNVDADMVLSLMGAVKKCQIYGAKNGYTYNLVALSRNKTAGVYTNSYVFYLTCQDKDGNYAFFRFEKHLNDAITAEGLLQEITLYRTDDDMVIAAGSLTEDDLPTKIVLKIDYNVIPDNGWVGEGLLASSVRIPFADTCLSAESGLAEDNDVYNPFMEKPEPYVLASTPSKVTVTDTGCIIDAGDSTNTYFGFKVSNAYVTELPSLAGQDVQFYAIVKFSGTDYNKVVFPIVSNHLVGINGNGANIGTISNDYSEWLDGGYLKVHFIWQLPNSLPDAYSGKIFFRIQTGNCSNPVTVDWQNVYFQYPDTLKEIQLTNNISYVLEKLEKKIINGATYNYINVSRDGSSSSGRTIHFQGQTAISQAINSIRDNSNSNRYIIHIEGEFRFTDPQSVPMFDGTEYSIALMKDYVYLEGDGPDKSIIMLDIAANSTFHTGKSYSDYQPIYFMGVESGIKGIKVLGKNCRYAIHIEHGDYNNPQSYYNKNVYIEDCYVEYLGHPDYIGSYQGCIGSGISSGQAFDFKNSTFRNKDTGASFMMHTPLKVAERASQINFENCHFDKEMTFHNYLFGNVVFVNVKNCHFDSATPKIIYPYYNNIAYSNIGDYTGVLMKAESLNAAYSCNNLATDRGEVLRVTSLSTGVQSKVRFGPESSAFNIIVGNSYFAGEKLTPYYWNTVFNYVYRDGGLTLHGQAFGTIDADEGNSASGASRSLGKLLGDCTSTNKSLRINIDSIDYTIVFNEDYTSQPNSYVLSKINAVIGSVATADMFCPAKLYYPEINGFKVVESCDEGAVLKGMGVVHTENGIRKAKNSDGYIDGVALDDFANGQTGRIITKGFIYRKKAQSDNVNFYVYDDKLTNSTLGETFGIDPNNDGLFKAGATPALLRSTDPIIVKIL